MKLKIDFIIIIILLISFSSFPQVQSYSIIELKNNFKNIEDEKISIRFTNNDITSNKKKSAGIAIIYSLLLPGMGELYAEGFNSGIYFTIADGILWGSLFGMNMYGNWQADRYKSYAKVYAGIDPNGKDKDFFATISVYSSIDDYNNEKALERNYKAMLDYNKYYWKWNSVEQRRTYRSMWTSSEETFNNIRFVVGGLILNRLVSAINALRLTSRYNKKISQEETTYNLLLLRNSFNENEIRFVVNHNF